jgi:hypothetical protein
MITDNGSLVLPHRPVIYQSFDSIGFVRGSGLKAARRGNLSDAHEQAGFGTVQFNGTPRRM